MWIFARRLDAGVWRPRAEHYCELLRGREFDREIHDPGFTFRTPGDRGPLPQVTVHSTMSWSRPARRWG